MLLKHLQNLTVGTLKYFFDFDTHTCRQVFAVVPVLLLTVVFIYRQTLQELYDGLLTVKEDAIYIQLQAKSLKDHFENSSTYEQFINYSRSIKDHLSRQ
jgi:hypothetical protein